MDEYDLYVGIPIEDRHRFESEVMNVVANNHAEAKDAEVMDGYWAGVNEVTLHFVVRDSPDQLNETIFALQGISNKIFIACIEIE
ncbi:TPA: hypothetical protein DCF80_04265 [Candidatus Saccharibacteria bacterium]|nr:hypothetical protein [Candidatus Saccharibacteria bacterium]HRK41240.1 hypothetical protein [Candidatus Saccharibacteria bacterium]